MGGRSRQPDYPDRLNWLTELSDKRLEAYGKMSAHKLDQTKFAGAENWDSGKESLNYYMVMEHSRRHGFIPEWDRTKQLTQRDLESFQKNNLEFSGKDHMEGYRFLKTGEKISNGDECLAFGQSWEPVGQGSFSLTLGEKFTKNMYPIRRKK